MSPSRIVVDDDEQQIADMLKQVRRLRSRLASVTPRGGHDTFTAAATPATTYQLTVIPILGTCLMALNGHVQKEGTDYTCDYTTGLVTVSATQASGDKVVFRYLITDWLVARSLVPDDGTASSSAAWLILNGTSGTVGPRYTGFGIAHDPWTSATYDNYKDPAYNDSAWTSITGPYSPADGASFPQVLDGGTGKYSTRFFARQHFTSAAGSLVISATHSEYLYVAVDGTDLSGWAYTTSPNSQTVTISAGDHVVAWYIAGQESVTTYPSGYFPPSADVSFRYPAP